MNRERLTECVLFTQRESSLFIYRVPYVKIFIMVRVPSTPYTRPTQRLSRPPPIQKLGAENHMLQLNI